VRCACGYSRVRRPCDLLAVGLQVVGKVPRAQSYVAAGLLWLIAALPKLLGAMLMGR